MMLLQPVQAAVAPATQGERGVRFNLGPSFYRPQSCFSRDLAVLSAVVHRRQLQLEQGAAAPPPLRVLDLMAGSGIRSMRYLLQAGADSVLCNDGDPANTHCLLANLSAAAQAAGVQAGSPSTSSIQVLETPGGGRQWRIHRGQQAEAQLELIHQEAVSLLLRCKLEARYFDLIDCDAFGAAAHTVGAALDAVAYGGLLCLTTTSGTIAGGRDPASAAALYGQHLAPMPFANEQGLRSLLGVAFREAAMRRLSIQPLWSLYSPHGPVFRTMIRVRQQGRHSSSSQQQQQYGYTLHWPATGESSCCSFDDLPGWLLSAGGSRRGHSDAPLLSGPLWLGPLHDLSHLQHVQQEAAARGWLERAPAAAEDSMASAAGAPPQVPLTRKGSIGSLQLLLELMLEEAAAEAAAEAAVEPPATQLRSGDGTASAPGSPMPPWYLRMNDVGRVGSLVGPPSRSKLAAVLRDRGFLAARSHIDSSALKTNASMAQAVAAAVEGLGIRSRAQTAADP